MERTDLVIVGAYGGTNVGDSMFDAARKVGLDVHLVDTALASAAPRLWKRIAWHLFDHRPPRLGSYSRRVVSECARLRPRQMLAVGIAPLHWSAVRALRRMGIITLVYLTDDPWNPGHRSRWAMRAIPEYDYVISPRRANLADLSAIGCHSVHYVPFGFDPRHFHPEAPEPALASDVLFVGGADPQRVEMIEALIRSGPRVALYGDYWERFAPTREQTRGHAGPEVIRRATASAKIALCLVRRANRDGHVMRSLEIPAVGACMLVEDTQEHRDLFGPDGEAVTYFSSVPQMVERATWLLRNDSERQRLEHAAHQLIAAGKHSYADRLTAMLALAS